MNFVQRWLRPIAILLGAAIAVFAAFYVLDHWLGDPSGAPELISDSLSALASMNAAVFGIVVTVVSIIVQLSAERFAGVTRMFLRDKVNSGVMGYYLVTCIVGVIASFTLGRDFVPKVLVWGVITLTAVGLALMAPYFGYVFWFLEPTHIVRRIQGTAARAATRGLPGTQDSASHQAHVLSSMEELTDISNNAIFSKDKIIASAAVDALKDFCVGYVKQKQRSREPDGSQRPARPSRLPGDPQAQPNAWYRIGDVIRGNPDFVAMDPESLADLEARSTWVEWKVLRQYLGIYNEALSEMRDICYLIAINTRYIGQAAVQEQDVELSRLVLRYMNSFLRATLNARDVRTAYNVLNQYRLYVESLLAAGSDTLVREAVTHMNYYGVVSFQLKLSFVTETIAYDVGTLCEIANALNSGSETQMLDLFLGLDQPIRSESEEPALLGIRKAQAKLAAYYLHKGLDAKVTRIAADMSHEPVARLENIENALTSALSKDFWEINDRGRNFEYMPAEQRACVVKFFARVRDLRMSMPPDASY